MVPMLYMAFVWLVLSTVVYIVVQTNVALNAFRTSTIIPQFMTKFAME